MESIIQTIVTVGLICIILRWYGARHQQPQDDDPWFKTGEAVGNCLFWIIFLTAIGMGLLMHNWN